MNLLDGLEDLEIPAAGSGQMAPGAQPGQDAQDDAHFFGPYQLIQQVGAGGVAKVFRARHIHPGYAQKSFAIKVLHEEICRDPQVVELFRHEAYVLSLLKHSNIVETFEAGSQDNQLFIAMEYIDGRDLDNMVIRCQQMGIELPIPVGVHIVMQALRGLSYAHVLADADGRSLDLVHRDINPANVFLSFDGRVKLGDFGVASIAAGKVQKERELAGKAGYFAPEQLAGDPVDHRADLFAVGVMMFEMLCGQRLFNADSVEQLMRLNKKAKIPKPSKINRAITPELEAVILKALQRKPGERFGSANEMLSALRALYSDATGMSLAVAALMRKVFLSEHAQEMQLREGLAGTAPTRGAGQLVLVCSADGRAQAAFNELLRSRGYRVMVSDSLESLAQIPENQWPNALLLDVALPNLGPAYLAQTLAHFSGRLPVVAFSESLEPHWLKRATEAGAVDLVFKPYNIERVLTSVRAAISGAVSIVHVDPNAEALVLQAKPKVMVLSQDAALANSISEVLVSRGYEVEVCSQSAQALERTLHASFQAVVYDAHPASPADRFFASQFRSQPGMGLVPILYLVQDGSQSAFGGAEADRSAVRLRTDPGMVLVETLNRLRGDTRLGRTYLRYNTRFPAEFRYGGRMFAGTVVDVSRGGVMVECDQQMPPIGTEVGLSLKVPGAGSAVEAKGRVARVDLPKDESSTATVGIEFERFAAKGESALIAYLGTLDATGGKRRQTKIIGPPPPAPKTQ